MKEELTKELKQLMDEEESLVSRTRSIIARIKEIMVELFKAEKGYEVGKEIELKGQVVKISSIRCVYGSPYMFYVSKKKDGTYGKMEHRHYESFKF